MARIYKVAIDPLPIAKPNASQMEMEFGGLASPEAECWYEYDPSGYITTHRTVSEPGTLSGVSAASSTWSASSFRSVSQLSAGPSAPPTRSHKLRVIRRRKTHELGRTADGVVAAIKNEETMGPQKDDAMRHVPRVGTEPLSVDPSRDGRLPSESEMKDDPDERDALPAAPFPVDEFQIALAPVQNPPLGEDAFDLSTIHGALPLGFSSRYIYDFNEMNNALPGTPFLSSSRRSFKPYPLTPGSKTHAKVRQIRGDGLHQRRS